MTDRRERELERQAAAGDAQAAERLYWLLLRSSDTSTLMDRLIEAAIHLELRAAGVNQEGVTVYQKINFVRGRPLQTIEPEDLDADRRYWSEIDVDSDLHRIPRAVRQPGFITYCTESGSVYRVQQDGQWERVVQLSAPPPGRPFHVVATLSERDALEVGSGEACLVLVNRGVYRSEIRQNRHSSSRTVHWQSVRIERRPG